MATTTAKQQEIQRTPFKRQATVITNLLKTNPMLGDEDKASMLETVGVLTWLNQLQIHWANGGDGIPDEIKRQIFDDRKAQNPVPQSEG